MIRITTFAIFAVVVALGLVPLAHPDGSGNVMLYAYLLVAWIAIFDVCVRVRFANYLGNVDEEAEQIGWPNGVQMLHSAKVVVFLMAVLGSAFFCIDILVNCILEFCR